MTDPHEGPLTAINVDTGEIYPDTIPDDVVVGYHRPDGFPHFEARDI